MTTLTSQSETYRTIIKQLLTQYAAYKPSHGNIETQTIFDTENDHYQIVSVIKLCQSAEIIDIIRSLLQSATAIVKRVYPQGNCSTLIC